jgi:hypothetical protein
MGCPSLTLRVTIAHYGIALPGGVNNRIIDAIVKAARLSLAPFFGQGVFGSPSP